MDKNRSLVRLPDDKIQEPRQQLLEEDPTLAKLPMGYRFLPTDEELTAFYLRNKIFSRPLPPAAIRDIDCKDLYKQPPPNLVKFLSSEDREWYFFTCYDEKLHKTSTRIVGDRLGFWKKANKDEIPIPTIEEPNLRATKNYLTYFTGREDTKAKKTHWQMEEYRLHFECNMEGYPKREEEWILVKIIRGGYYKSSF